MNTQEKKEALVQAVEEIAGKEADIKGSMGEKSTGMDRGQQK